MKEPTKYQHILNISVVHVNLRVIQTYVNLGAKIMVSEVLFLDH